MQKSIFIFFTIICVFSKVQSQDLCFLNDHDTPCVSWNININLLKTTFNHIHDSTDYFSSRKLKTVQLIMHDTLLPTRVWGKDTVLNIGEYTMLLHYKNDSIAKIA